MKEEEIETPIEESSCKQKRRITKKMDIKSGKKKLPRKKEIEILKPEKVKFCPFTKSNCRADCMFFTQKSCKLIS